MGTGASLVQEDKHKPVDASDITTLEQGTIEIRRLRLLATQNPGSDFDAEAQKPENASDIDTLERAKKEIARLRTMFRIKIPTPDRVKIESELQWEESELTRVVQECKDVVEDAASTLDDISKIQLSQLAATGAPVPQFHLCMQAILTLLSQFHRQYKKVTKWKTALLLLKNPQFISFLTQYSVRKVQSKTIGKLQKFIDNKELSKYAELSEQNAHNAVQDVHQICATHFMRWVRAINNYTTTVSPRIVKVKALKDAIEDLKSPEEKVAERFTSYRKKGLLKLYNSLDRDSNGALSFVEIQTFLAKYNTGKLKLKTKQKEWTEQMNVTFDQARRMVGRGDGDGGYFGAAELDFEEFVAFMLTLLRVIFNKVDCNHDSVIAFDEMTELLKIMYGPSMGVASTSKKDTSKLDKKVKQTFRIMMKAAHGKNKHIVTVEHISQGEDSVNEEVDAAEKGTGQDSEEGENTADLPEGVDLEVFIDFMIDVLVLPANMKKNVLQRLLTLSVDDNDWEAAKKSATLDHVQVAIASGVETKVSKKVSKKKKKK